MSFNKKCVIGLCLVVSLVYTLDGQTFQSSNLPVIVIDTDGQPVVDEPKITATIKMYDRTDGSRNDVTTDTPQYEGFIGIELRGQSSQAIFPKKSYGIETRDEMGNDLAVELLGMPEEEDWVIYSPYSDKSLIRNTLAYLIAGDMMTYAPRVRMVEMVINGDYQGVGVWTEKVKRDKNRVDIAKLDPDENSGDDLTGGYIIKFDKGESDEIGWISPYSPLPGSDKETRFLLHYPKPEDISPQQKTYIQNYITDFENALMSPGYTHPFDGYLPYIDVESFIQTIIINELSRNVDGYRLSTYMYKDKDSKGGKLTMGPTWDHNLSWGNADYCNGWSTAGWGFDFNQVCPQDYWVNHIWWERLMSDGNFRQKLKDTWSQMRTDVLSTENILGRVDSLADLLSESSARNFQRWPVLSTYVWPNNFVGQTYTAEIDYLKNWILQRLDWLDSNFKGLTTAVVDISEAPEVLVYPNPTTGRVRIKAQEPLARVDFYSLSGHLIHSEEVSQPEVFVDLEKFTGSGLIWYKLYTREGDIITGKISTIGN